MYWPLSIAIYCLSTAVLSQDTFNMEDAKIFAHRGGIRRLVPASSELSFTIGAQQDTDYLELDIGSTADHELVVIHDILLDHMTDVGDHPEFADKKQTFNYTCNEPNDNTPSRNNRYCSKTGFFAFNFTLAEMKTLTLRCREPFEMAENPLNDRFEVLTFREFLHLVNNLSVALDRSFGITPELKSAPFFRRLGLDLEWKYMELLLETGFVEKTNGYYKTKTFQKSADAPEWPLVIVQSDSPTTLFIIGNLSDNDYSSETVAENVPLQFGIYSQDMDDLSADLLNWVNTFAGGLNIPWTYLDEYYDIVNNDADTNINVHFRLDDFVPGTYQYTDQYTRNHYFIGLQYRILYGLDAIFTDNVQDLKTIIAMLNEFSNSSSLLYSKTPDLFDSDAVIEGLAVNTEVVEETGDSTVLLVVLIVVIVLYVVTIIVFIVMWKKKKKEGYSGADSGDE